MLRRTFLAALLSTALPLAAAQSPAGTQILKWKGGRKACFMLAFDDSAPSQLKNVVPELNRRRIVGNFFLVTGNSLYAGLKSKWEEAVKSPYIFPNNHTFTHKGVTSVEQLDEELAKCNEVLYALHPEQPVPRLLGFGRPGGVPWTVTPEEQARELEKNHLVDRPPFWGSGIHLKSTAELVAVVDKALAKGEMGHVDFHGVGGDWLVTPMEWFTGLLDKLEAERDQLWITDTASWYKYAHERDSAKIAVLEESKTVLRLTVTTPLDPKLYNEPLTLSTKVPADWKSCTVRQGPSSIKGPVQAGVVQYDALPDGTEISLTPN